MEILVYIQLNENSIMDFSLDLISYAKEISNNNKVSGAIILPSSFNYPDFSELKKYGLDKLYLIKSNLPYYDKRKHPYLLIELIKKINPEIFILNSTTEGREIAPVISSSLNTGLTADCTKLEIVENKLISTRPTFGGKLMASIMCKKNPQMATVRINTFKKKEFETNENLIIEELNFDNVFYPELEILEYKKDEENEFLDFQNAKIVLAGGMGLKNKENFDKLKLLAKKMNAQIGATRKAIDKGLIEKKYQIGQTGSSTTPEIYLAFGISGAIHHISGMENSKKIIAINTDKNAPIFEYADTGIVDDAIKIIDELLLEN